ncbi:MAG: glucosaminidase domain-containing protein, partial [Candidatus Dormiibacterota bacterium]
MASRTPGESARAGTRRAGWVRHALTQVIPIRYAALLVMAFVVIAGLGLLHAVRSNAATPTSAVHFTTATNVLQPSGLSAAQINSFVAKKRAGSPYATQGAAFLRAEQQTGVSAQLLVAMAALQTSWGTVIRANNVYAIGGESYPTLPAGIIDGAAWIKQNYLTSGGRYYVAPTLAGMGVHYATSSAWAGTVASIAEEMYSPPPPPPPPPP